MFNKTMNILLNLTQEKSFDSFTLYLSGFDLIILINLIIL